MCHTAGHMQRLLSCLVLCGALGCANKDAEHPSPSANPSGSAAPSASEAASAAPAPSASEAPSAAPESSASAAPSAAPAPSAPEAPSATPESSASAAPSAAPPATAAEWTYGGETGPSFWGELRPDFAPCKAGTRQSPVDFPSQIEKEAPKGKATGRAAADKATKRPPKTANAGKGAKKEPAETSTDAVAPKTELSAASRLSVDYLPIPLLLRNDGHAIEVVNRANNYLALDGKRFELLGIQFRSPSEHTFQGRRFELEMQLVHKSSDGSVAVVAVVFEQGGTADPLVDLWKRLPKQPTPEPVTVKGKPFDVAPLVTLSDGFYAYEGSFTTPPCAEGVLWFVMKKPQSIGVKEVERYRDLFGGRTNRMVMPLGDRTVFELRP